MAFPQGPPRTHTGLQAPRPAAPRLQTGLCTVSLRQECSTLGPSSALSPLDSASTVDAEPSHTGALASSCQQPRGESGRVPISQMRLLRP